MRSPDAFQELCLIDAKPVSDPSVFGFECACYTAFRTKNARGVLKRNAMVAWRDRGTGVVNVGTIVRFVQTVVEFSNTFVACVQTHDRVWELEWRVREQPNVRIVPLECVRKVCALHDKSTAFIRVPVGLV